MQQNERMGINKSLKHSPAVPPMVHVLLKERRVALDVCVCMVCTALMTTMVPCDRSQDWYVSVNACVHVVYHYRHLFVTSWTRPFHWAIITQIHVQS